MKIREIAELVGGTVVGDPEGEINGIASLSSARPGDLAFYSGQGLDHSTMATCVLVSPVCEVDPSKAVIRVSNPKLAFAKAGSQIAPQERPTGWDGSAFITSNANVEASYIGAFVSVGEGTVAGEASEIHEGSRIGRNVTIGARTIINANCVILEGAVIGNDCVIHPGVVIGSDGFGYVRDESGEQVKFPQIGTIVIEDDVEIGANSCIDRGSLGETRIGEGTKIDNLVQIAHNVQIGKRCIIASLTGISGSSILEDDVVLAGQVGIADHVTLRKGVVIGAKSAVFPYKIVNSGVWCGVPVQRIEDYKRQHAILKSVGRIRDRVDELEKRLLMATDPAK